MIVTVASQQGRGGQDDDGHPSGRLSANSSPLPCSSITTRTGPRPAGPRGAKTACRFAWSMSTSRSRSARDYEHVVFDTKARPDREELKTLAEGCDLMVIPTTPDAMSIEALMGTVDMLRSHRFRAVQDSHHHHPALPRARRRRRTGDARSQRLSPLRVRHPRSQGVQAGGPARA